MRRCIGALTALALVWTACGTSATVTAETEIGVPTTSVIPVRFQLSGTSWHVATIDEAGVVGLEIEFVNDPESNDGRLTASFSGLCESGEATLLAVTDETFLVESWGSAVEGSEACSAGESLSTLFTLDEIVEAEFTRPGLRLSTSSTTISADQIFLNAEAVERASVCTPLDAYEFATTIPGEWWCEE